MAAMGLRVVSPLLGAGLLAWAGPLPVVLLDAGTFVAAAGAVAALRVRERAPAPASAHWRAEIAGGIPHVGHTPVRRPPLVAGVPAPPLFGFFETPPFTPISPSPPRAPPLPWAV